MSSPWCWYDAKDMLTWLQGRAHAHCLLSMLVRLPLADALVLARLSSFDRETAVYYHLHQLQEAGLIASIRLPLGPSSSPYRFHLTDLGLATIALEWCCEPSAVARRFHLRRVDLLGLLPQLPQLTAAYEMLGTLAASQPGRPALLTWDRPWRRRYQRPAAKTCTSISVPAFARLSWNGREKAYLLIPDLETIPLRLHRTLLDRLLLFRRTQRSPLPPLVVATGHGRVGRWNELLEETARMRLEGPLIASVVSWRELHTAVDDLAVQNQAEPEHIEDTAAPMQLLSLQRRHDKTRLPLLVGPSLNESTSHHDPNSVALTLAPAQRILLDLVARHPFLTSEQLATVLGWQVKTVRRRQNQLQEAGLMRLLSPDEIGDKTWVELMEVTGVGLRLVAAQLGLTFAVAVRIHGLAGGGPESPIGVRDILIKNLAHTRGTDELFVGLFRTAHGLATDGGDDAVTAWQNAAACSRRHLRPDGYGTYRRRGQFNGFFLEYDRGTMNRRDYFRKFAAYYDYAITRRFEWDYDGYPTILVVTASNTAEERIASVVRHMAAGRNLDLPLLLTTRWRLDHPSNRDGLLGRVWREPNAGFEARRLWLSASTLCDPRTRPGS